MLLLIGVMFAIFFLFGKNIVITYNVIVSTDERMKSVSYFSAFMLMCGAIWFLLKYATKPVAFVAFFALLYIFRNRMKLLKKAKEESKVAAS